LVIALGFGKTIKSFELWRKFVKDMVSNKNRFANKSLVEQTEEDFVNVGLDVGVYYGDRKVS
jgi:hypothetical protein